MNLPALMATYQLRQREYLLRITRAMTSRLDLPSLLRLILTSAAEMVGCRAGLIALWEDLPPAGTLPRGGDARFHVRAVYGISPDLLPAFAPLLVDIPFVQEVDGAEEGLDSNFTDGFADDFADDFSDDFADGFPGLMPDDEGNTIIMPGDGPFADDEAVAGEEDDPASSSDRRREWQIPDLQGRLLEVERNLGGKLGQVVSLLLLFEDELLGVIYLFRGDYAFTPIDRQVLQGFADQAAIAVRNARLYQQRETERSRLATIIENSADGIMILDPARRVLVLNQALATMIGIQPEEAAGRPCRQVMDLHNVTGVNLCDDPPIPVPESGSATCEGELRRAGGKVTVSVTFTPLRDAGGRVVNIIVNVMDITRFKEEEEVKSTFISVISHELKTPVALIKGYAQTLARPDAHWDAETARQSLEIIEEEADRLEALINNLLDVSRIQAQGLRLDLAEVDTQRLATRVADAYRTQTDRHTIELDFPEPLPLITGDEERLRQVLTNLLGNAIKYSPDGGLIRVGGWLERSILPRVGARVVLYVADQGVGIPEQELPHIFDRFYRVDSSLRRTTSGTGLGLFLCRVIVDAHGGTIWARSQHGTGTTFFVALPVEEHSDPSSAGPEIDVIP